MSATTTPRLTEHELAAWRGMLQVHAGVTQQLTAESNLVTTRANFRRIVGNEPENLAAASPVDAEMVKTLRSHVAAPVERSAAQ